MSHASLAPLPRTPSPQPNSDTLEWDDSFGASCSAFVPPPPPPSTGSSTLSSRHLIKWRIGETAHEDSQRATYLGQLETRLDNLQKNSSLHIPDEVFDNKQFANQLHANFNPSDHEHDHMTPHEQFAQMHTPLLHAHDHDHPTQTNSSLQQANTDSFLDTVRNSLLRVPPHTDLSFRVVCTHLLQLVTCGLVHLTAASPHETTYSDNFIYRDQDDDLLADYP